MAGRAAIFELLLLSFRELDSWNLLLGGFPEVVQQPRVERIWFQSYIQTYLERDVRSIRTIKDLSTFRRFLSLVATRHGQMLNKSDLASPLGISVPTITEWLSILEVTGEIIIVPPFFENFGKRLIKSPKIYWIDSGLVSHLLGIQSSVQLENSPFLGAIFEGFIASEIIKNQINRGERKELYYFRDEQGLEVDFVRRDVNNSLEFIEAKWSKTVVPKMAVGLQKLMAASGNRDVRGTVVYRGPKSEPRGTTVAKGVRGMGVEAFLRER